MPTIFIIPKDAFIPQYDLGDILGINRKRAETYLKFVPLYFQVNQDDEGWWLLFDAIYYDIDICNFTGYYEL